LQWKILYYRASGKNAAVNTLKFEITVLTLAVFKDAAQMMQFFSQHRTQYKRGKLSRKYRLGKIKPQGKFLIFQIHGHNLTSL
jgi:hypothetical protein